MKAVLHANSVEKRNVIKCAKDLSIDKVQQLTMRYRISLFMLMNRPLGPKSLQRNITTTYIKKKSN
jgi:hypothetical protein